MNEQDLKLELSKMAKQQQQWHDEFELKMRQASHLDWEKSFWIGTVILLALGIIFK